MSTAQPEQPAEGQTPTDATGARPDGTTDGTTDGAAPRQREHWVSDEIVAAKVRSVPRYGVFLTLGFVLGAVVALILTFTYRGTVEASQITGAMYSPMQVFGFLTLILGAIGMGIAGCVALILDRVIGRHARTVIADRETVVDS
ncbi:hypothetical protein AB2L57_00660 [Microbacterium sp. HA-8]|uniref:hypothetical protein n=1 Tax=unclassified Microbacterium TaxID=2609290 RepID=UPI0025F833DA|nr:hypothetical protein [Microbacterium sp.]